MTATDEYGMNLDDLTFDLSIPGGGATMGSVQSTGTQVDVHTATRTGTIEILDLTGCSATVRLEVQASDACGRAPPLCVEEVQVTDETPPDLTCPEPITVECVSHCGTPRDDPQLAAFFAAVSATDNCDGDVAISDDAPDCFPTGENIVTFTATDNCGLQTTCERVVTVEDTTPPEITVVLNLLAVAAEPQDGSDRGLGRGDRHLRSGSGVRVDEHRERRAGRR